MKLVFHGGASEVGRSCIELVTEGDRYILDAGIKFQEHGFLYPDKVLEYPNIDGLFLTHAHLDHSGALPLFEHYNLICPIFTTVQTKVITKIMLKDSYKIARIKNLHPAYNKTDLKKVKKAMKLVHFLKEYTHRTIQFKFFNAGHIPGSASILIRAEGKNILYTGDINTRETELMYKADTDYGPVDILITESTYGNTKLPDRKQLEQAFLDKVEETIERGGSVLIPTFALGRAQEILHILSKRRFHAPIYFDGMCRKLTSKILANPSTYVRGKENLSRMFYKVAKKVKSQEQRRELALHKQAIYVTTSGMLQGGPIMHYLEFMWGNPKNSILMMGFQCKRTNGRHLFEDGYVYLKGWKTFVKCEVQKYDFSGHSDTDNLKELITKVNPKHLIIQHGDPSQANALAAWAKGKGFDTFVPKVNDAKEF